MNAVITGNVTVKVQGVLKQRQLPGNWAALYDGSAKNNRPRIELFAGSQSSEPCLHTITLENLKFAEKSYRPGETFFILSIKKEKHHFQCQSEEEKEDWVQSLCHVSSELWKQWASDRESSEVESDSMTDMSYNVLYDSCDKVQQFKVSVNPNKASEANSLQGHYLLNPTRDSLRLLHLDTGKSIHDWPYRQIRKYGCTRKIFKIEVGRQCSTGAGEFEFFALDGQSLAETISAYTKQMFYQEQRQPQWEGASSTGKGDGVEHAAVDQRNSDPAPQEDPPPPTPQRMSESLKESKGDARSSQGSSNSSLESKRDVPIPVPRASINRSKKESSSAGRDSNGSAVQVSDDTKIYETASGLTAPLNLQLKHELQSKLQVPESAHEDTTTHDSVSANTGNSATERGSTESVKGKKMSEKDKKKLEKEQKAAEAKRKKQLEKEQREKEKQLKEQREKEAKEEKERQKKLKKETKGHEKLKSKKSLETPAPCPMPASFSDGHIYDEPGELLKGGNPAPPTPTDSGYCDASDFVPNLPRPSSAPDAEGATSDVYALPQKPKNSWKIHARPEAEDDHQEDYNIQRASQSATNPQRPPVPPHLPPSHGPDNGEDTYNHLGDFKPLLPASESIYGLASAKETVHSSIPPVEDVYEDANSVYNGSNSDQRGREPEADYDEAELPPSATIRIDNAYEEVSQS